LYRLVKFWNSFLIAFYAIDLLFILAEKCGCGKICEGVDTCHCTNKSVCQCEFKTYSQKCENQIFVEI